MNIFPQRPTLANLLPTAALPVQNTLPIESYSTLMFMRTRGSKNTSVICVTVRSLQAQL